MNIKQMKGDSRPFGLHQRQESLGRDTGLRA